MPVDPIHFAHKKINVLMAENSISVARLCEEIGMTSNGYSKMWKNRSIKVETIQKIADFFELPLSNFIPSEYQMEGTGGKVEEKSGKRRISIWFYNHMTIRVRKSVL